MKVNRILLFLALVIGVTFHGSSIFFTLEYTYDALIHLFFANHYADNWFEHWDYRWYTGFTVQGYPPLVHQAIGLLSYIGGLKFGLYTVALIAIILFITGAYRFALMLTASKDVAGYTSLLAVFSSTFVETLHIFGQLPSIAALSILMHCMPEIYNWLKTGKYRYLFTSLSLLAVTVTSHHVTPIFGMVFFIFPLIGLVIMDVSRENVETSRDITFKVFLVSFKKLFWRIVSFGFLSLILIVVCILPYWINSKKNPITQVPIPHGSRDNFLEVTSSGLVFFVIPWGVLMFLIPYIFYRFYSKRYLFYGLSISMLTLLGTGGTTPIPRKLLGETAFNILTLDRFTLWATIMALPILGEFAYRLVEGDLKQYLEQKLGKIYHRVVLIFLAGGILFMGIFTMSLGYFRPSQPTKINMLPIVNFLNEDQHYEWRYLPLGFGDQMAWLSAQSQAMTVDGNYHSARRLPELTSRAIERLENSKFRGVEGIGSLQQFLTVPEKYNLKFIFSNDKFYDPILYFTGWHRLQQLENGIMVWERLNVSPLPEILAKDEVPTFLKIMWGTIPMLTVIVAFMLNIQAKWFRSLLRHTKPVKPYMAFPVAYNRFPKKLVLVNHLWALIILGLVGFGIYHSYIRNNAQYAADNVLKAYYDALDFKEFVRAHSYLDPDKEVSLSQYLLEISVSDGILSSYAKMDSIGIEVIESTDTRVKANVHTKWITPLEKVSKTKFHEVIRKKGKWYLSPDLVNNDIPPDQLVQASGVDFYNHGRRKITTQQMYHEDILQQPKAEVLSAKLIKKDGKYAIIGELQNVDNAPADIILKATLYNDDNVKLASYDAKHLVKHKLLPKETTVFRIDFEGIAWSKPEEIIPETFDPDEFTPIELSEEPTKFNLQCAANVANKDLYKKLVLQNVSHENGKISGTLFNSGVQEVTIPQLLLSYYDANKELVWVDHTYLEDGVRIERSLNFTIEPQPICDLEILNDDLENCSINGYPNFRISEYVLPNRNAEHPKEQLQPISGTGYNYIKIDLNSYVGNPR